jgi:hypothetical protein
MLRHYDETDTLYGCDWSKGRHRVLPRLFRRPTHMQMAQIAQRRTIFLAHAARKVRVIQPLIPRAFRHILQQPQSLLHRLTPVRRHLSPSRQHVILDMLALLRSHSLPDLRAIAQNLALRRRQPLQSLFVL